MGEPLRAALAEGAKNPKPIEEALLKVGADEMRLGRGASVAIRFNNIGVLPPASFDDLLPRVDIARSLESAIAQARTGLGSRSQPNSPPKHVFSKNIVHVSPPMGRFF